MNRRAAAAAVAVLLGGCASQGGAAAGDPVSGYLNSGALEALAAAGPPPVPVVDGEAWFAAVAPGADRWWLATAHAELRPPWAAQHFDCVLGTQLAQHPRPALTQAMARLRADAADLLQRLATMAETDPRLRPFATVDGLRPCVRTTATETASTGPSGTAVLAGAYGELFADLAPDAADQARAVGRELAWSAVICRTAWPTDVEAGLTLGQALYREAARATGMQADLAAARAEISAARAEGLRSPACAAEHRALRQWSAPPADQPRSAPSNGG